MSPESLLNYLKGVNRTLIQFSDAIKLKGVTNDVRGEKGKIKSSILFLEKKIPSRFVPGQDNFSKDISLAGQSDLLCLTS